MTGVDDAFVLRHMHISGAVILSDMHLHITSRWLERVQLYLL
jgi:hypothetical protein